ncbi:CpsB/CapC family capsule biosynthesis tyrosine phosphatase [Massilibacteroides sp.]|uniref:tyrosine-protein phosphatase n=1 Tax=Massilibacteroides sp. TaxID=2034766 RepID=UPI00260C594E|nr:CpsB/CapC family capsule biosynthesis tyrosine phosphatase [Massilibacteroides sp.]MDD4515299.1 hypothetical protein [Massilibacteroides sp.]
MKKKKSLFYRFSAKRSFLETDLLSGFTDIHSHYLPGVDDGFQTKEDAINALDAMIDVGVKRVYLTPHVMADLPENYPDFLKERFLNFQQDAPKGVELRLAAEYMLDADFFKQKQAGLLPIGKNYILIEMSYMYPSPELINIIYDLQVTGFVPLLAHPERYLFMDEGQYKMLKEKGCKYQLNLMSLSRQYGERVFDTAWYLLQHGMYDFVGTDIHQLRVFLHNMTHLKLTTKEQDLLYNLIRQNERLW